jgi:hypothetical protein
MSDAAKPNPTHFGPYLNVTDDGYIWWPLKDAIRLGAGFRPFADNHAVLETELRAPNKRALANERTLIGAFGDARLSIAKPMTFERDGFRYVDAGAFLTWLSQYICRTQAKIEFPDELVIAVRNALAKAEAERPPSPPKEFESLTLALEEQFDQPLDALPDELRHRVEQEFLVPWRALAPAQRRSVALQWDYQSDPATREERQFWWDFYIKRDATEKQIAEWESASAPTASDLALKEARLKELRQELARMELQERQTRSDYYPLRVRLNDADMAPASAQDERIPYIAYPKAMKLLAHRLDATPEELAAWIWTGPKDGGLAAYLNANELDPPPRFHYNYGNGNDFDYLSPLMACWFGEDDIAHFEPTDRYITGKTLIERWGQQPGLRPEAFIRAKIAESRLLDGHPICGSTQGTCPEQPGFPPLASGLFLLAHVEEIEAEDFAGSDEGEEPADSPCQPVSAWQIRHHFPIVRDADANEKWWKEKMADAERYGLLDCRVGEGKKGPGGSLWRPDLIAGWLVDRQAKDRDGLSLGAARAALKKFPGCEEIADELFPPDE